MLKFGHISLAFFLNHSWHHTIRSTPYAVFFCRTVKNVGKVTSQMEYMEEDFLYMNDGEDADSERRFFLLRRESTVQV